MTGESIEDLRRQYHDARARVVAAVDEACPGPHHCVQHRDGKPPWCKACGCDAYGVPRRNTR